VVPFIERLHNRLQRSEKQAKQYETPRIGMAFAVSWLLLIQVKRGVGVMSYITGTGITGTGFKARVIVGCR